MPITTCTSQACSVWNGAFTDDNDPHGEHDFGAIDEGGVRCFWKIEYYDRATEMGSPDPTDPAVTTRVPAGFHTA